jgi:hypothetical protein
MRSTLLLCAVLLSACHVSNRVYNPTPPLAPAVTSVFSIERNTSAKGQLRTDKVAPDCNPVQHACLAFLEFDEFGEPWDPGQFTAATQLIDRAKNASPTPIVVTFTHGWKNNADERDGRQNPNVTGFEGVLDFLHRQPKYHDYPIVGLFISWRGELVSPYWPVGEQFSYFNREGAAIRIPGASMTGALTRIMIQTRRGQPGAHLIMVGHSFGGLMLERALTQAMTDYVLRQASQTPCTSNNGCPEAAWPDLVVFVNSAAAATEGKQMLNFLQRHDAAYTSPQTPQADSLHRTSERPLFLSISSLGDAATRFAMPIGHALPFLQHKIEGSWRDYGSQADPPGVSSQSSYYLATTAHMQALQSHIIVDTDPNKKEILQCNDSNKKHEYFGDSFSISTGQQYQICKKPGTFPEAGGFQSSWNRTPYWAMEMPATIVPDHSGIFNANFVTLLNTFFLDSNEMANPPKRPILTAK